MTWTPPDHGFHPRPRAGVAWKIGNSLWLLAPLLSFGCASVAGFLYVGLRARRPAWWIAGICYSVVANVSLFWSDSLPEESNASTAGALIWVLTWVVSVAHAVAINSAWLRWLSGRQSWRGSVQPVFHAPPPGSLPPELRGIAPAPDRYYGGPGPAPFVPPDAPAAYYTPPPFSGPPAAGLLDVNTAGEEQLAALPAVGPDRAARAVAARRERNGFTGVAEFAAAAGLAPHQFAAIRDRLTCTPAPAAPHPPGEDLPFGRIVDV